MELAASADLLWSSDRERILQATAELCARQGYEETTVAQVIERAAVSEEAFERLFGDLEAALIAVINALLGELVTVLGASSSAEHPEPEAGLRGMRAILELMAAHPSFAYVGYVGARQMAPPQVRKVTEAGTTMITAMLDRLWQHSDSEVQPSRTALATLGGIEAVLRREVVAGRAERLPSLLPELAYGAAVPFLGQERALALSARAREMLKGTNWE